MTNTNYAYQGFKEETMSRVYGRSLPISMKKSVEVCRLIRGRSVNQAKALLKEVAALKRAVPYKRFNQELAHQKNVGSGGYPVHVSQHIVKLLNSVEANASAKGLNEDSLKIVHACAHLASRPMRYGRKRRVKAKRTHIEIVVQEMEKSKKSKQVKSAKKEVKPVEKVDKVQDSSAKVSDTKPKQEAKVVETAEVEVTEKQADKKVEETVADKVEEAEQEVENESVEKKSSDETEKVKEKKEDDAQ